MYSTHQYFQADKENTLISHGYSPVICSIVHHEQLDFSCMVHDDEPEQDNRGEANKAFQSEGIQRLLGVGAPGEFRLDDHDDDAEHAEDERVVAEALALLEESPAMSQLVADVLVLLLAGLAPAVVAAARGGAGSGGAVERQVVGVVVFGLGDHDLRGGGAAGGGGRAGSGGGAGERRLERLRLGVQVVQVPAGRAQVAERPHDAAVVPAAAHGYFGEGVALPALLLLVMVVVMMMVMMMVSAAAADTAAGAGCLLLLQAMALVVLGILVRLSGRASMAGRGELADVQLDAVPGGGGGRQRRGVRPKGARKRRGGAEQQGQVIPRGCRSSPV